MTSIHTRNPAETEPWPCSPQLWLWKESLVDPSSAGRRQALKFAPCLTLRFCLHSNLVNCCRCSQGSGPGSMWPALTGTQKKVQNFLLKLLKRRKSHSSQNPFLHFQSSALWFGSMAPRSSRWRKGNPFPHVRFGSLRREANAITCQSLVCGVFPLTSSSHWGHMFYSALKDSAELKS